MAMRYVLVQWSSGNIKSSILTENYVRDKSMLYDCTKEGVISFVTVQQGDVSSVKNKGKLGRIACVSDDRKLLEEHQNLLAEESEFIEEDIVCTPVSKRPRLENGVNNNDDVSSVAGLKQEVSRLLKELSEEKTKVKELQTLNQQLQTRLPDLLCNAMQSSNVATQLRACPSCNQCSMDTVVPTITIPEEAITNQDVLPLPTISTITSEARTVYTSPLNTPQTLPNASIIASPSIVKVHSNTVSPQLGSKNSPSVTLPGMLITEDSSLPKISSAESLRIMPFDDKNRPPLTPNDSTQGRTPALPLEVTFTTSFRKMTLALLSHLFDKEVLRVSSVTGSAKKGEPNHQALDKHLVQYIIDSVQARFPNVQAKDIKATMAQKCKYLRLPKKKRSAPSQDVEADEE